jgi:hypothetical protein
VAWSIFAMLGSDVRPLASIVGVNLLQTTSAAAPLEGNLLHTGVPMDTNDSAPIPGDAGETRVQGATIARGDSSLRREPHGDDSASSHRTC